MCVIVESKAAVAVESGGSGGGGDAGGGDSGDPRCAILKRTFWMERKRKWRVDCRLRKSGSTLDPICWKRSVDAVESFMKSTDSIHRQMSLP